MAKLDKKRLKSPVRSKRDARAEAWTVLSELYRDRSRADDAPSDLAVAMKGQPTVTPGLKEAPGGIAKVLEALRAFDNPDAQAFATLYDSLTETHRRHLTLEEIAVAADVGSRHLLGLAAEALNAYGQSVSQIILWAGMPAIVKRSVQAAKSRDGAADREMMLKAGAVLPVPKGSHIAIQQVNQVATAAPEPPQLKPWNQEAHLREIAAAMGDKGALPAAKAAPREELPAALNAMQERTTSLVESPTAEYVDAADV